MAPIMILLALVTLTVGREQSVQENTPPPAPDRCPLIDINFNGHDVDEIDGIVDWQQCGMYL